MARKDTTKSKAFEILEKIENGHPVKFEYSKSLYDFLNSIIKLYFETYKVSFIFTDERYSVAHRLVYVEPNAVLIRKNEYFDVILCEV